MGIYLSTPSSEIFTEEGACCTGPLHIKYAVGEMQGWRKQMEDAHITIPNLREDTSSAEKALSVFQAVNDVDSNNIKTISTPQPVISLFGVFDGHGGKEVAKFTKLKYPEILTALESFQAGDYELALRQSFHRIDETLEDTEHDNLLSTLRSLPNPSDDRPHRSAEPSKNRRAPDAMLLDAIRSAADTQSTDESNQAQDLIEAHNLNKKKTLSTAQAVDLIRSILNNAQMKRPSKRSAGDSASKSMEETEKVLDKLELRDLFIGDDDTSIPVAEAEVEEPEPELDPEEIVTIKDFEELETEMSALMALEDDRIKDPIVADIDPDPVQEKDGKEEEKVVDEGGLHGDRKPKSSSVAAYEPSKSTATGMTCTLKDHRVMAGCTAIVALAVGTSLYVANAGDSRGVLCRGRRAYALSEDHKPQQEREMARITKAGGYVNFAGRINGNLNLSRSLGDLKYKQNPSLSMAEQMITAEPDITVTTLQSNDRFFLLACDGIWDCLSNQQAVDFVSERLDAGMEPSHIVQEVCKRCLAKNPKTAAGIGGDNMTCLLVLLDHANTNTATTDVTSNSVKEVNGGERHVD